MDGYATVSSQPVKPEGGEDLVCRRDGTPTRLRCARCETGICPACLVRTPVGYKCAGCAGEREATGGRTRTGVLVASGVVVVALLIGVGLIRTSGRTPPDGVAVDTSTDEPADTEQPMIGEEARDGQLVFVVDDFGCEAKRPPTTGRLCMLRFHVTNGSSSPAALLGRFQYLVDPQSKTYGADDALTRAISENGNRSLAELNINPEVTVALTFVFDLPDAVEPMGAQFRGTGRSRIGVSVRLQRRA